MNKAVKNQLPKRRIRIVCFLVCSLLLFSGCTREKEKDLSCFLTIDCSVLLSHREELSEEKKSLVPKDGMLLVRTETAFSEGESVLDILKRVTREQKLHMEYTMTPGYQTAYVEGIGNLYDFDCGELSGWTYLVNGEVPQIGCSQYFPEEGDEIVWKYTVNYASEE